MDKSINNYIQIRRTDVQKKMTSYYVIPLEKNLDPEYILNAIKLVNNMLDLGVDVWWLQEIKAAKEIVQDFTDKDTIVYGSVAESMLPYLNDSINRLEKIKRFDTRELAFKILELRDKFKGNITDEYVNLMKKEFSSYKKAPDAYKYGVESKIVEASFAVTRAEKVLGAFVS